MIYLNCFRVVTIAPANGGFDSYEVREINTDRVYATTNTLEEAQWFSSQLNSLYTIFVNRSNENKVVY